MTTRPTPRRNTTGKGVVLEGVAEGIPATQSVSFNKAANQFILDGTVRYPSPLPREQMAQVIKAIARDDRMGVSFNITSEEAIVFGSLGKRSDLTDTLVSTDTLLAGVTFGWDKYLAGRSLPNGYVPEKVPPRSGTVGFYVFDSYRFTVKDGVLQRSAMKLRPQVLPVLSTTGANGGFQLDEEAMKKNDFLTPEHQANLREIYANLDAYLALEPVAGTIQIGEAAAFARFLSASGIPVKPLLKQM